MVHRAPGIGIVIIVIALVLLVLGIVIWAMERGHISPWSWKLPGDIHIRRGPVSIWIPLGLSLLLSVVATILLSLFRR